VKAKLTVPQGKGKSPLKTFNDILKNSPDRLKAGTDASGIAEGQSIRQDLIWNLERAISTSASLAWCPNVAARRTDGPPWACVGCTAGEELVSVALDSSGTGVDALRLETGIGMRRPLLAFKKFHMCANCAHGSMMSAFLCKSAETTQAMVGFYRVTNQGPARGPQRASSIASRYDRQNAQLIPARGP
jgi:hypothetical protein